MLGVGKQRAGMPGPALVGMRGRQRLNWHQGGRVLLLEALLIIMAAVFLVPFAWLISISLKPETQVFSPTVIWIPHPAMWWNYVNALTEFPLLRHFTNTMIICLAVVVGPAPPAS